MTEPTEEMRIVPEPVPLSACQIFGDGSFVISRPDPKPCWWWRMWQWILLGWKWVEVTDD